MLKSFTTKLRHGIAETPRRCFIATSSGRGVSTVRSDELVSTQLNSSTGIAVLTMQNLPVNSLSLDMCQELVKSIKLAESDPKIQALILQSNSRTTFSAGLDILEIHNPEPERLAMFWKSFQNLYFALYGSRLACIAAIEGHAPAAGCMLALSCDYRIMAATDNDSKAKIGLNETHLGIVAPPWMAQQMMDCVGRRQTELALSLGKLYSPEEALTINLVDKVVGREKVRAAALVEASDWTKIPAEARVASKQLVRKRRLDTLRASIDHDVAIFVGFITNEKVQKTISAYLEVLIKNRTK